MPYKSHDEVMREQLAAPAVAVAYLDVASETNDLTQILEALRNVVAMHTMYPPDKALFEKLLDVEDEAMMMQLALEPDDDGEAIPYEVVRKELGLDKNVKTETPSIPVIKKIVDAADPIRLLEKGCPDDEYKHEIQMLADREDELAANPGRATQVVREVFEQMFWPGWITEEMAVRLGSELYEELNEV